MLKLRIYNTLQKRTHLIVDSFDLSTLTDRERAGRDHLTLGELCAVARSRSGMTLDQIVKLIGASKVSVHAWERRSDPRMIAFWEDGGYRFPTGAPVTLVVRIGKTRRFDVGIAIVDRGVRVEGSDSRLLRSMKVPSALDEHEYRIDEEAGVYHFSTRLHGRRSLVVSYEPV
jgi:hypothetical protein